jgi:hypothetical protein
VKNKALSKAKNTFPLAAADRRGWQAQFKSLSGFPPEGGWGISPPSNDSRGISPLNLNFLGNFILVLKI